MKQSLLLFCGFYPVAWCSLLMKIKYLLIIYYNINAGGVRNYYERLIYLLFYSFIGVLIF